MDMEDTLEHIRYGSMVGMLESTVMCVCVDMDMHGIGKFRV